MRNSKPLFNFFGWGFLVWCLLGILYYFCFLKTFLFFQFFFFFGFAGLVFICLGGFLAKIIHDSIYGSIKFDGVFLDLIDTPELQRLRSVRQLGLSYLVFPGSNHSRFEHSLGTSFIVGEMADELGLSERESDLVRIAGLLHDVGHGPFSHSLGNLFDEFLGKDHMEVSADIIRGDLDFRDGVCFDCGRVPDILEREGFSPDEVADLVLGEDDGFLGDLLHGNMDADQIDYLLRDAHYTGVAHGVIDWDRVTKVLVRDDGGVFVKEKGVEAVEGMLVARNLMYSSVYFHHTSTIAEAMLRKATRDLILDGKVDDFYRLVDSELLCKLSSFDETRDVGNRIRFRRILKRGPSIQVDDLDSEVRSVLSDLFRDYDGIASVEDVISDELGVDSDSVVLEFSTRDAFLEEEGGGVGIKVRMGDDLKDITEVSSVVDALRRRETPRWVLLTGLPNDKRNELSKERLLEILKDYN